MITFIVCLEILQTFLGKLGKFCKNYRLFRCYHDFIMYVIHPWFYQCCFYLSPKSVFLPITHTQYLCFYLVSFTFIILPYFGAISWCHIFCWHWWQLLCQQIMLLKYCIIYCYKHVIYSVIHVFLAVITLVIWLISCL